MARVLDTVFPLVTTVVLRPPVGQGNQQLGAGVSQVQQVPGSLDAVLDARPGTSEAVDAVETLRADIAADPDLADSTVVSGSDASRIDERDGRDPHGAYDERNYETAYDIVRDMLGHASVVTTKDIYLEPVKRLRSASLFNDVATATDLSEVIARLVGDSDRVLDTGTVFESGD